MTRPRSHYNRGEKRRAQILDAAIDVIAERGLEGVTHRAVANAAGVPLSATSYFFASMDELIGAAVTRIADGVLQAVESFIDDTTNRGSTETSVDAAIDRMLAALAGPRDRQIQVQFEAYLATNRRPDLIESVRRIVEAYEHAATTILASLGATEPEMAARHLIAVLDGFALQRIANPRPDDQDAVRAAVNAIARTYLDAGRQAAK